MIVFISGKVDLLTPTKAVFNINGLGYQVNIPLSTYRAMIDAESEAQQQHAAVYGSAYTVPSTYLEHKQILLTHQIIREDANLLFGFFTQEELDMFRHLLSVPGIGATTALNCLSSRTVEELASAIGNGESAVLRKIKGIAEKGANQIIVSLQKMFKDAPALEAAPEPNHEAVAGLVSLGYSKKEAVAAVSKLEAGLSVAETITKALQMLSK